MRTTLNLDEDVSQQLVEIARSSGRSVSRVANQLLRGGLLAERQPVELTTYDPPRLDTGTPLVDVTDIGEALEKIENG